MKGHISTHREREKKKIILLVYIRFAWFRKDSSLVLEEPVNTTWNFPLESITYKGMLCEISSTG